MGLFSRARGTPDSMCADRVMLIESEEWVENTHDVKTKAPLRQNLVIEPQTGKSRDGRLSS